MQGSRNLDEVNTGPFFYLQVDLFVNYDCDLQAANLFERTLRGLARVVRAGEASPGMLHAMGPVVNVNAAGRPKPYQLAADVALLVVRALDAWAGPLKVCRVCWAWDANHLY